MSFYKKCVGMTQKSQLIRNASGMNQLAHVIYGVYLLR